jgi:hypothetical protein
MKRIGLLAVVLTVVLSGTAAWADFYVIAGGRPPGTRITSAPYTISTPGFYYLGGNLTYSGGGSGYAIFVSVDDVTLDLMGFSLINGGPLDSTLGILIHECTNVEIRNGVVRGFFYGVSSSPSVNHCRVLNVRATDNARGISLNGSDHLIKGCNVSNNNVYGIILTSGVIMDCVASNNQSGIRLYGPGSVLGNTAVNNSSFNFDLGNAVPTAILVDGNSAFGLGINYSVVSGTTGVQMGNNAGTP